MHDGTRQWGLSLRLPIKTRGEETKKGGQNFGEGTEDECERGGKEKKETRGAKFVGNELEEENRIERTKQGIV
jgi:hypothetical protein